MDYFTTSSNAAKRTTDCVIVGVYDRGKLSAGATEIDAACNGELRRLVKSGDVSAKPGRCILLTHLGGVKAARVAVVGLGKASEFDARGFCRAVTTAIGSISDSKCKDVLNTLTLEGVGDTGAYYLARQTVQTIGDVLYRFTQMKSSKKDSDVLLRKIGVSVASRGDAAKAMLGAKHGDAVVTGMSLAKDLGNLPPNVCTPTYLARTAQKLAKGNGKLTTRVINEADMKRLGMHSLLSVTAGTQEPAKLIVMQYKNGGRTKPIVLVGKGVTFDSGGISLKPGPAMDEMKFDMCGAAGVIGTMATVAALQLPVNLNVVVPAVENLPGSKATVPGDIVKSMSGQTIEILNTDAEGRLILCDALTYSRRFKPDTIIDVATLTGACVIALGKHHTGLMTSDDALADEIVEAGANASDRAWRLPLTEEYAEQLKSNFADFANVGGRDGGAITAGCFLGKFTDGLKWAHLDIAGTAWKSGQKKGATGRPVPMLAEFILSRCNALP
jgi:leucyl aminopeptidase